METGKALVAGTAGSLAFITIHEALRKVDRKAPRMDILGQRALVKFTRGTGTRPPQAEWLYYSWLCAEIMSNALYFSLVGLSRKNPVTAGAGLGLGLAAGVLTLAGPLGVGKPLVEVRTGTALRTLAIYAAGGLVAGAVHAWLGKAERNSRP